MDNFKIMAIRDIPYKFLLSPLVAQKPDETYRILNQRFASNNYKEAYLLLGKIEEESEYTIEAFDLSKKTVYGEFIIAINDSEVKHKINKVMQLVTDRGGIVQGFTVLDEQ